MCPHALFSQARSHIVNADSIDNYKELIYGPYNIM